MNLRYSNIRVILFRETDDVISFEMSLSHRSKLFLSSSSYFASMLLDDATCIRNDIFDVTRAFREKRQL